MSNKDIDMTSISFVSDEPESDTNFSVSKLVFISPKYGALIILLTIWLVVCKLTILTAITWLGALSPIWLPGALVGTALTLMSAFYWIKNLFVGGS
jgi:hypothetical protein